MGAGLVASAATTWVAWARSPKRIPRQPVLDRAGPVRAAMESDLAGHFTEEVLVPTVEQLLFTGDTFDVLEEPSLDGGSSDLLDELQSDEPDRN